MAGQTAGKDYNRSSFLYDSMDALHDQGESCCSVFYGHDGSETEGARYRVMRRQQNVCEMMMRFFRPVLLNCTESC